MTDRPRRWVLHGVADDAPGVSGVVIDPPEEVIVVELDPERTVAAIARVIEETVAHDGDITSAWPVAQEIYDALDGEHD